MFTKNKKKNSKSVKEKKERSLWYYFLYAYACFTAFVGGRTITLCFAAGYNLLGISILIALIAGAYLFINFMDKQL